MNNKPLLVIYRPERIKPLRDMINCWNELAKKWVKGNKFGISTGIFNHLNQQTGDLFDYGIEYQPGYEEESSKKHFL